MRKSSFRQQEAGPASDAGTKPTAVVNGGVALEAGNGKWGPVTRLAVIRKPAMEDVEGREEHKGGGQVSDIALQQAAVNLEDDNDKMVSSEV